MTDLIDYHFEQETVRVVMIGDAPWWIANDIAKVLGYRDAYNMARNLDDDEKGTHIVSTLGGDQELSVISESGLFAAILKSRRPEAKRFRRWVTGDVLPTLRRTGRYTLSEVPPELLDDAEIPRLTAAIGVMREARQVWGREECRRIWIKIGLPSPIAQAQAELDEFAQKIKALTNNATAITTKDLAEALGVSIDTRTTLRIAAVLRLLGWGAKKERVEGALRYVWRRGGAANVSEVRHDRG